MKLEKQNGLKEGYPSYTHSLTYFPNFNFRGGIDEMVKALDGLGIDALEVKASNFGDVTQDDIREHRREILDKGWDIQPSYDTSIKGANEVFICRKIKKCKVDESLQERKNKPQESKESSKVRDAIDLINGDIARRQGYKLDGDTLILGNGVKFKYSKLVIDRLKELGYGNKQNESLGTDMNKKQLKEDIGDLSKASINLDNVKVSLSDGDAWDIWDTLEDNGLVGDIVTNWGDDEFDFSEIRKGFVIPLSSKQSYKTIDELVDGVIKAFSTLGVNTVSKEDIKNHIQKLWDDLYIIALQDEYEDVLYELEASVENFDELKKLQRALYDAYSIDEMESIIAQAKALKGFDVPDGFEWFEGHLNDPYQPLGVGAEVITKDGEHYWITFVDNWDDKYAWGSPNKSDIKTEQGYSIDKDDIRFVKPHAYNESLKEGKDMSKFYTLSKEPVDIDTEGDEYGVSRIADIPLTLTDEGREKVKEIGWSTLFADKRKGIAIKDEDIEKTNVVVIEHEKDGEGGVDVYLDINDYLDLIPIGDSDDFLIANNDIKYDEIEKMLDKYFATTDVEEAYAPNRQLIGGEWKTFKKGEVVPEYLWSAVCSGSVNTIKKYFEKGGKPNKRYPRFGTYHSLIMGALRNGRYDIAELLQSYGETVTDEEKEEYDDLMAQREERDRSKVMKESKQLTEAVDRDELAKFIEDSVDDLKNGGEGCWYKKLGACASGVYLYCVVGFGLNALDFAPSDVQHLALSKDGNSVICVKVAVNGDDYQADYDWDWVMPYSEDTMEVWDTEVPVSKDENYTAVAQTLINTFNELKELNIDEDGVVIDTPVEEACKSKDLKEGLGDDDDIRTVVYDVLHDHAPKGQVRDEMYDLMLNLTDRALSWLDDGSDIDGAVQQAIDDGMIYTDDRWTAYRHYCDIGDGEDAMWEGLYNDLGSILYICTTDKPDLDDVDYDAEDEGAEDPMTGDNVWESLNNNDEE